MMEETDTKSCSIRKFREDLQSEHDRLTSLCESWENMVNVVGNIPDSIKGEVRCVVGQARLVMVERFQQFSGLIDNCEFNRGNKETTCMDLKGFWEMIFIQVEDVDQKFQRLEERKRNNWEEVVIPVKKDKAVKKISNMVKKLPSTAAKVASSNIKAFIANQRKISMKNGDGASLLSPNRPNPYVNDEEEVALKEKNFDGGFFNVTSPVAPPAMLPRRSCNTTPGMKSLKVMDSNKSDSAKRISGYVSPYISQIAKRAVGENLSSGCRRSNLFDDEDLDKENIAAANN